MSTQRFQRRGEWFANVVLYVTKRDASGRPREARFLYDEETHAVKEGDEFLIVFAPEQCLEKKS